MTAPAGNPSLMRQHRLRALVLLALVIALVAAAASDTLHAFGTRLIDRAEPAIVAHPLAGALLFLALSALSAMVVFFTSALLTPLAVDAFGPLLSILLLWAGWVAGGMTAWAIGRFFGERLVSWFVSLERLRAYEEHARRLSTFGHVLLFQLAVPSEIPGYVLGLAGCPFRTFASAMALAELPIAIGAVYLGQGFLSRDYWLLLSVGIAGIAATSLAVRHAIRAARRDRSISEKSRAATEARSTERCVDAPAR